MEGAFTFLRAIKNILEFRLARDGSYFCNSPTRGRSIFFFLRLLMPRPGQAPDLVAMRHMPMVNLFAWSIIMAAVIGVQEQAVRWMLKRPRWSDFRLVIVPQSKNPHHSHRTMSPATRSDASAHKVP